MPKEPTDPKLQDKLVWVVAKVNRQLEAGLSNRLKSRGLPIEQYWIMEALCENGPTPISQLAETAHSGRPNATKIIDKMVSAGLVFREPDAKDRRVINIVPTDEGRLLYEETSDFSMEIEREFASKLKEDELAHLKDLLQTIS
ncbi:MAG: MarR family transcriptional regulator [Pseudomonadota bacterium]